MAAKESLAGQQHQLALDEQPERTLPPTYASYDWTGDGLAERSGDNAVVYYYWDQPFGCKVHRQHRDPEDLLPSWPIIDAPDFGRKANSKSVLAHCPKTLGTGISFGPNADKSIQDYLATLPRSLLSLAAPFGEQQWLLMDLFRRSPGLWRNVYQQTALGRLGTFSLTLELFLAAGRKRPQQREEFARFLTENTRETALRRYLGHCPDAKVLAILEQIPPETGLLERRAVKTALKPTGEFGDPKELIRLKDDITETILSNTDWEDVANIRALLAQGLSFVRITQTIQMVLKNLTPSERPAALKALSKVQVPQSLQWWSAHWTMLAGRSRSFPPPPIPSAPLLSPLETAAAMDQESRRMRNGNTRFLLDVLAGDLYFYHWDGDPPATLCLAATDSGDWILLDALSVDGAPVHPESLVEIVEAIQAR